MRRVSLPLNSSSGPRTVQNTQSHAHATGCFTILCERVQFAALLRVPSRALGFQSVQTSFRAALLRDVRCASRHLQRTSQRDGTRSRRARPLNASSCSTSSSTRAISGSTASGDLPNSARIAVSRRGDARSRRARRIIPSCVSGPNILDRSRARAPRAAVATRRGAR